MPTLHAPAKINLGLHVLRRRSDGYHDIETVLLRVSWHDVLSVAPAATLRFTCSDPALPTGEANLCVAAAKALAVEAGIDEGAALRLDKRLPYGAGLGGGSSDAAATLMLLADFWKLDCSQGQLHDVAAALGADVPFFLGAGAEEAVDATAYAAYATGRGDQLRSLTEQASATSGGRSPREARSVPQPPYRLPFSLVVVVPPVEVSTADAYRLVEPTEHHRPSLPDIVRSNDLVVWREHLTNDFQAPIFDAYPAIENACIALHDAGAEYTSLSGSGSAVYGCFSDEARARAAAESARRNGLRVWWGAAG